MVAIFLLAFCAIGSFHIHDKVIILPKCFQKSRFTELSLYSQLIETMTDEGNSLNLVKQGLGDDSSVKCVIPKGLNLNGSFQNMQVVLSSSNVDIHLETWEEIKTHPDEMIQDGVIDLLRNMQYDSSGLFFRCDGISTISYDFRCMFLETPDCSLEIFIQSDEVKTPAHVHDRWNILPTLCHQVTDAVHWLHKNGQSHGLLHPRNIFVKKWGESSALKVLIPENPNVFGNFQNNYAEMWTKKGVVNVFKRDIISLAIVSFYILTCGTHPCMHKKKKRSAMKETTQTSSEILENIADNKFYLDALLTSDLYCSGKSCKNCATTTNLTCRTRAWRNILAEECIKRILDPSAEFEEIADDGKYCSFWMNHPFFWSPSEILTYLERSVNFLKGRADPDVKKLFGWTTSSAQAASGIKPSPSSIKQDVVGDMRKNYKGMMDFLESGENNDSRHINNFYRLISQIRNHSCHWSDTKSPSWEAARQELEALDFISKQDMSQLFPDKYCLFMMAFFPTLLTFTWEQLKDKKF